MAVNRKPPQERVNLDPGLKRKTNFEGETHLKHFWNDSQWCVKFWIRSGNALRRHKTRGVTLLNLDDLFRGLVRDVVGRADRENTFVATDEESPLEEPGTLIVQEIFVPAVFDQFGDDHDDAPVGMFG